MSDFFSKFLSRTVDIILAILFSACCIISACAVICLLPAIIVILGIYHIYNYIWYKKYKNDFIDF